MDKNISGKKIKEARISENPVCTQKDLSARLEILNVYISDRTISKMELGIREIRDYQLVAFAKALKVNILWLLGESLEKKL